MISTENKSPNPQISNQELFDMVLDITKKVNDIHRLHFSEDKLKKLKNQKQKFLAEILTSSARNSKKP